MLTVTRRELQTAIHQGILAAHDYMTPDQITRLTNVGKEATHVTVGNFAGYNGELHGCGCPLTQAGYVICRGVNWAEVLPGALRWYGLFTTAFDAAITSTEVIDTLEVVDD